MIGLRHIILSVSLFVAVLQSAAAFTLVIDAGHGGQDAGAIGAMSKEKDINLRTALAFGHYVEQNCPDVKVIYTRKTDVFVTLHGRAEIANKAKADLFVSIHTNAQPPGYNTAKGLETYTLGMHRAKDNLDVAKRENSVILVEEDYKESYQGFDPNSAESYIIFEFMQDNNMQRSVDLAKFVQKNVCALAGRPDKGVKQAGFLVLRETSMPSCLIELGFISTPSEEQFLNTEVGIDNIGRGIYNAFVEYRKKYDNTITVPFETTKPILEANGENETAKTEEKKEEKKDEKKAKNEEKKEEKKDKKTKDEQKETKKDSKDKAKEKADQKQETKSKKADAKEKGLIFKVQIVATDKPFAKGDPHFKGRTDYEQYVEKGMTKYTIGATKDYKEVLEMKAELQKTFSDCFVVAFLDGEKISIAEALKIYKKK